MSNRWYRAYEGTVTDAKLAEVALVVGCSRSVVIATWHAILENAASLNDGGRIEIPSRRIAAVLCEPFDTIETVFLGFETVGLVRDSHVAAWKKRQHESDSSTERSRRSREAAKEREEAAKQQQCNADATLQKENETSPSVYVSVSDKRTSSEKITDEFEIWYAAYPLHKGRGAALRGYRTARGKAEPPVLFEAATGFANKCKGMEAKFIPHPATWLNQERWLDDDLQPSKPLTEANLSAFRVEYGSDEWWAWDADYKARGKNMPNPANGHWTFPSRFPEPNVQRETSSEISA